MGGGGCDNGDVVRAVDGLGHVIGQHLDLAVAADLAGAADRQRVAQYAQSADKRGILPHPHAIAAQGQIARHGMGAVAAAENCNVLLHDVSSFK